MQTRNFQLADLSYFIEVCRLGSIAQAANFLGLSQPALSKSVRRLEQIAGARLLDRTTRGVSPTVMGKVLLQRAHFLLSDLEATRDLLQSMSGARAGSVAIGVPPTLSHEFLPEVIRLALLQRPGLNFRVQEGLFAYLHTGLQQGELDFIISSPAPAEAIATDLGYERLGGNLFMACVAKDHPILQCSGINAALLHECGWVLVPPPGVLRSHLDQVFHLQGFGPLQPKVQTSSPVLSKKLIVSQKLVGFLPLELFAQEEEAGEMVRIDLPWLNWQRELTLITRKTRSLSPAAAYVIELVRQQATRWG